jgi:hypothetical protein
MSKYSKIDLSKVKTISINERKSKVNKNDFGKVFDPLKGSFNDFINSFPDILVSKDLKEFAKKIAFAYLNKKPVILFMGAHSIKVGLSPLIVDLIKSGIISCVSTNGAGAIHDVELSLWGKTSEDVAANLQDGTFGMSKETAEFINLALVENLKTDLGYGESLGKKIVESNAENIDISILGQSYLQNIPMTIHVGIGTDIIYQHPNMDGAAAGELSYRDFKILAEVLKDLGDGGVVLNVGSAVICPEVFLKTLTVVRNLGFGVRSFYTATFDMNQQYRARVNIVQRPTLDGGKGYYFTGHHEIMLPLLIAMVKNEIGIQNGK